MPSNESPSGLNAALLAVQKEAPKLQKDKINPHFKSTYLSLETLHEAIMPLLNKHGLIWTTGPSYVIAGDTAVPTLAYKMIHAASGEVVDGAMPLSAAKSDPQGQGSAITYARRYALMAVLGLVADEDDDGNAGSRPRQQQSSRRGEIPPSDSPGHDPASRDAAPVIPTDRARRIFDTATELGLIEDGAYKPVFKAMLGSLEPPVEKVTRLNVDSAEAVEAFLKSEAKRIAEAK